jgi:hypothetical protein
MRTTEAAADCHTAISPQCHSWLPAGARTKAHPDPVEECKRCRVNSLCGVGAWAARARKTFSVARSIPPRPQVSATMPTRIKKEVARYLEWVTSDSASQKSRVQDTRLVAFSCKGREWCPSCTRRSFELGRKSASEIPDVAHRQWTLSLPISTRFAVEESGITQST